MSPEAQSGSSGALDAGFEQFVLSHSLTLLRSAYLLTGDYGQAEDLLQLTLLRTARRWEVARESPEAYARRVLINLLHDRRRQSQRRVTEQPLDAVSAQPAALDHAKAIVGRDAIVRAIRELPGRQQEVIVLRFFADLSVAETAAAIGAPQGTVKSDTARALARLRQLLADEPQTPTSQGRGGR